MALKEKIEKMKMYRQRVVERKREQKRIEDAVSKGNFMCGEGDYIVYEYSTLSDVEIIYAMGPVSKLSKQEQLRRLMHLWAKTIVTTRNLEKAAARETAIAGEVNMESFDYFLRGIPKEVLKRTSDDAIYRLKQGTNA